MSEASLLSDAPVIVESAEPASEPSEGSDSGTKYTAGSNGSEVVSPVPIGLRAHFGNGGSGASGGMGKCRTGGDSTCRNVALKYRGRMAANRLGRPRGYRDHKYVHVGLGLTHLRSNTMKNSFSRATYAWGRALFSSDKRNSNAEVSCRSSANFKVCVCIGVVNHGGRMGKRASNS